ncbi:PLP-dependent aminotransferase family protein [Pollutibacter soli]|uniref:aminotransferase-like domain-containing protein n=1 Tax=Pollutibacter soli TaxID=3034157 RepID=UPI003013B907
MLPFSSLIIINRKVGTPVYLQVANQLITLIRKGNIQPGSKLPASREMAEILQLHRKTVVAAYDELVSQDWAQTNPRRGITVSNELPLTKPRNFNTSSQAIGYSSKKSPGISSFPDILTSVPSGQRFRLSINDGYPDHRIAPTELLLREYKSLIIQSKRKKFSGAADPAGIYSLREVLAGFVSETRGLRLSAANVMITRGAQMSIYLASQLLVKPGSVVLAGDPNYHLADVTFKTSGARLVRVPVDENGMDIDWVSNYCSKQRPDLIYIIPHHHHPTTVTLTAARRMALLNLVVKYQIPVIEDDYDFDFHYSSSPILPLASSDHDGLVIYIGSLTKSLSPGFRVGYMIGAESFIQNASKFRRLIDIRGDHVLEEALAYLFEKGDMQRHLKKSVKLYHQRRDVFAALLTSMLGDRISFKTPSGGLAFWVRFAKQFPLPEISSLAAVAGLQMSDGLYYNSEKTNYNGLRMGFASMNEKEMRESMGIVQHILYQFKPAQVLRK